MYSLDQLLSLWYIPFMTLAKSKTLHHNPQRSVLVTGGAGFIGSHVVDQLLALPGVTRIVVVDNFDTNYDPKQKRHNTTLHKNDPRYRLVTLDIGDRKRIRELFKKERFTAVVHLAAQCDARKAVLNPLPYLETNIMGTWNLLECAREFGVEKFIFASTSAVYGNGNKAPYKEDAITDRSLTVYGASKKSAEQLCYTYHHNFGMSIACLRIFNAYGERMRPDLVLPTWVRAIRSNEPVRLSGKGTRKRDYTYVGDIARGFISALVTPLSFEVINLGSSRPIALTTLLKTVEKAMGKRATVNEVSSHSGSVETTHANTARAQKILGWKPTVSLAEGVERYVRSLPSVR
jgi:UDP-glucuronate 4-epimerase